MIDLNKEAEEYAGIKTSINDYDEQYFNSHGINIAKSFIAGANSKYVEAEKLKFAIEAVLQFRKATFGLGNSGLEQLQKQLKELKDE
jgi:hypothetical protein